MSGIWHHYHWILRHGHIATGFLCVLPAQLLELGKEVDSTAKNGLTAQGDISTALSPIAKRVELKGFELFCDLFW